ncbi:uncharacterized protein MONBRDRAFT_2363, partial [Monosiga brevicollis MX1]
VPCWIHQTYKDYGSIPNRWRKSAQSWQRLHNHSACRYVFWSDTRLHRLVATHYPSLLATFEGYPRVIQRVDAARYMILHRYGGIYVDLDIVATARHDPLLERARGRMLFNQGMTAGVSNDMMLAPPGHPFLAFLLERLRPHARDYLVPYLTTLLSAGSLFCTASLAAY